MSLTKNDLASYLERAFILQLATAGSGNRPWVCSVYFVADDELNLYWLSLPSRRHSIEIEVNPKVAVTMAIKTDQPIIGLGAEGIADKFYDIAVVEPLMEKYVKKYDNGREFLQRLKVGKNDHVMYKFKPAKYVLFDELNYPDRGSIDFILDHSEIE